MSAPQPPIQAQTCRQCPNSDSYQFSLDGDEDGVVTVAYGRPPAQTYKAISYVWRPYTWLGLECLGCGAHSTFSMRDAAKLKSILRFARAGSTIWLDALSIDQHSEAEKAALLGFMGDIYRQATAVAVFLPASDRGGYEQLKSLAVAAHAVTLRRRDLGMVLPGEEAGEVDFQDLERHRLVETLVAALDGWNRGLHEWLYWRRAWTFQEWTMASELEVSYEGAGSVGIANIKNVVVEGVTIATHWKNLLAKQSQGMRESSGLQVQVQSREDAGRVMHLVKCHFPFAELAGDELEDQSETRERIVLPPLGIATSTGTELLMSTDLEDAGVSFRSLIGLALNAIGMSQREASVPADLVHCWASMCNVKYAYSSKDSYYEALHKVLCALRKNGLQIFNFLANTSSGETDLAFLDYAAAPQQANASGHGFHVGNPVFTGRTDTATHVRNALRQDAAIIELVGSSSVTLQEIQESRILAQSLWSDKSQAISELRSSISGTPDNQSRSGVVASVSQAVDSFPETQLSKHRLVTLHISTKDENVMDHFEAWSICPSEHQLENLFVARESLNGTLVLATRAGSKARIVSYVFISHQRDGTFLVKVNLDGLVDHVFRTQNTPWPELPAEELELLRGIMTLPASFPGQFLVDLHHEQVRGAEIWLDTAVIELAAWEGRKRKQPGSPQGELR